MFTSKKGKNRLLQVIVCSCYYYCSHQKSSWHKSGLKRMNTIATNDKRNCLLYLVPELITSEDSETELYNGKASKKIRVRLLPWRSDVTSLFMSMDKKQLYLTSCKG